MVGGLVEEHALPALGFGWSNAPTIDEVLHAGGKRSGVGSSAEHTRAWAQLQAACKRFVKEQEARRSEAQAFDVAFLARLTPPQNPTLCALFQRLVALRQGPRAPALKLPDVRFEASPPGFSAELWVNDPLYAAKGRGTVYIDCRAWQEHVRVACSCGSQSGGAECVHALLTLDAALVWLANEADDAHARILARPPWQRLLDAIDEGLGAEAPVSDVVLSWRVSPTGTLTAYEQKPLKRGGLSSGSRVELADVHDKVAEHLLRRETLEAFEQLIGHPRVFHEKNPNRRVRVERGEVGFSLTRAAQLRLQATLNGTITDARTLLDRLPIVLDDDTVYVCRVKPETRAVLQACIDYPHAFPADAERALLDRLPRLERVVRVELPKELQGDPVVADPRLVLRLFAMDRGVLVEGLVTPLHESFRPGEGPTEVTAVRDGRRVYAVRDLAAEKAHALGVIGRLPLGEPLEEWRWHLDSDDRALALLAALQTLDEPVACHWREETPRRMSVETVRSVRMRVKDNRDWFGLEGDIELAGDKIKLATLLDALRKGNRFVKIGTERWMAIENQLKERLERLNEVIHTGRVGPEAAPVLRELDDMLEEVSPKWLEVQKRLAFAETIDPDPPKALKASLREYQLDGYRWLSRLAAWGVGGVLADDMGIGKTMQALAVLIDRASLGPQLVIAPLSVCFNWAREIDRFAPSIKDNVLVLSYGQVTRDYETLMQTRFATLVLDEAQAVKNADTQRARAVRALQADFKFALSGTPIENHTGELWSILRIVAPGLLGSWEHFRTRFAAPIDRDGDAMRRRSLARLIQPFVLRRTKAEVLSELPPRTEVLVSVVQSPEEQRLYEDARLSAVTAISSEHTNDVRFEILAAITRLRLLACHPRLFDKTSSLMSSKLEAFMRTAHSLRDNGHKALVFSQFTSHLKLVKEALDAAGFKALMLDGGTPAHVRERLVDEFQKGEADLFLVSLKAGGFGLNLTAADDVIHLDPWWNPAVEEQATGRAHRIGQTRPVTVYRFVSEGTIEETILALHKDKRELVSSLLDGSDSAGKLSAEQLFALISAGQTT